MKLAEKENQITSYLLCLSTGIDFKNAAVSFLYLHYYKKYNLVDEKLYSNALNYCLDFIKPISNRCSIDDINKIINECELEKDEYAKIALDILSFNKTTSTTSFYLSYLIYRLLDIKNNDKVFDLGSGNGSFLSSIGLFAKEENKSISLLGQEISTVDCNISKMILAMLNFKYDIENINSLLDDNLPLFNKGYIFPPFNLKLESNAKKELINKIDNNLFNIQTSAEWFFVFSYFSSFQQEEDRVICLLPDYVLFRSYDSMIRKYLLENKLIKGIIQLNDDVISKSNIHPILLILSKNNSFFKALDSSSIRLDCKENIDSIINEYSSLTKTYTFNDIKSSDNSLSINSLQLSTSSSRIESCKNLQDYFTFIQGSRYNINDFKDKLSNVETSYKLLQSSDIDEDTDIDFDKLKSISENKKYDKYKIAKNDLLITSRSSKVKISYVDKDIKDIIIPIGGIIILRAKSENVNPVYIKLLLESEYGKNLLQSISKGTITSFIPIDSLKTLNVKIEDIKIQNEIANQYLTLHANMVDFKKKLNKNKRKINNLICSNFTNRDG